MVMDAAAVIVKWDRTFNTCVLTSNKYERSFLYTKIKYERYNALRWWWNNKMLRIRYTWPGIDCSCWQTRNISVSLASWHKAVIAAVRRRFRDKLNKNTAPFLNVSLSSSLCVWAWISDGNYIWCAGPFLDGNKSIKLINFWYTKWRQRKPMFGWDKFVYENKGVRDNILISVTIAFDLQCYSHWIEMKKWWKSPQYIIQTRIKHPNHNHYKLIIIRPVKHS